MEPDVERSIARSPPPLDTDDVNANSIRIKDQNGNEPLPAPSYVSPTTHDDEAIDTTEKDIESAQAMSIAESCAPPPVRVPRSSRRGLFSRFCLLAEVEEPKHYSRNTKWLITFVIALAAIAAPLGSAIILRKSLIQLI